MFRRVDSVLLRVPDLESALRFYREGLGHPLRWRWGSSAAALGMGESDGELVLKVEGGPPETDLLVDSVPDAIQKFTAAGGVLVYGPFLIATGWCAWIRDPWGNHFVILDHSKGPLKKDHDGNVVEPTDVSVVP